MTLLDSKLSSIYVGLIVCFPNEMSDAKNRQNYQESWKKTCVAHNHPFLHLIGVYFFFTKLSGINHNL